MPTVPASFFWLMLFVAFFGGIGIASYISRAERTVLFACIGLLREVLGYARIDHGALPSSLRKRIAEFVERWGSPA